MPTGGLRSYVVISGLIESASLSRKFSASRFPATCRRMAKREVRRSFGLRGRRKDRPRLVAGGKHNRAHQEHRCAHQQSSGSRSIETQLPRSDIALCARFCRSWAINSALPSNRIPPEEVHALVLTNACTFSVLLDSGQQSQLARFVGMSCPAPRHVEQKKPLYSRVAGVEGLFEQ